MWWYEGSGWMGWIVTGLVTVAVLLVLVVAGLTALRAVDRRAQRDPGSSAPSRTSEQLLDDRFARGEIDEVEYERRRDLLRSAR
jgi:putative membrane protein